MRAFLAVMVMAWMVVFVAPTAAFAAEEPYASDECGVDEVTDASDLTAPDAPWVDLCEVGLTADVDRDDVVQSVTVTIGVAGNLAERLPTGVWRANLNTDSGCRHGVLISDGGINGTASARVESSCGYIPQPCTGVLGTIYDTIGGGCSMTGLWEHEEEAALPLSAVAFGADTITVTLQPRELSTLLAQELSAGATITSVEALTATSLTPASGVVDYDFAYSTGRSLQLGR